jgi:nitroreductase
VTTNPTLALLHSHRSIRNFTDAVVPDADIDTAVRAGQAASTSSAVQAYSLLQVTDLAVREAIVPLTGGQTKIARCGAFFIVCGDVRRHRLVCEAANSAYDAKLEAFLVATADASLFAQNLVVAFESMGYGICFIGGLRNQLNDVEALIPLPEGVYPLYGLCVGVPAEAPIARPRLPLEAVWFKDSYPDDATVADQLKSYDVDYAAYMEARGAKASGWTSAIARGTSTARRTYLGEFYTGKGADLS